MDGLVFGEQVRPTRVNRLFSTMNAEFSIGALLSPVMSRAPSNTVTPVLRVWPSIRQDLDKYWQWRHENPDADNPGRDDRGRDERDVKSELDVAPQKR